MGYRISKVYTRTGDDGQTGLADGRRVGKTHPLVQAMGAVDELNAHLGVLKALLAQGHNPGLKQVLENIQQHLFNLGGDLALPGGRLLDTGAVAALEAQIDSWNETLPPLENFILPGGSQANAQAHLARAVARRAERQVQAVFAAGEKPVNPLTRVYLNRLGDWLFVLARVLDESPEVLWQQPHSKGR